MDINEVRQGNIQWTVFYKDKEIGYGYSQAEALGKAFAYLNQNDIKPKGKELRVVVRNLGTI